MYMGFPRINRFDVWISPVRDPWIGYILIGSLGLLPIISIIDIIKTIKNRQQRNNF